jgi:hypothetical protein
MDGALAIVSQVAAVMFALAVIVLAANGLSGLV